MGLISNALAALNYPEASELRLEDPASVRALVTWLEHKKIRHLAIEDRKALDAVASNTWDAAFERYLQALECPIPWSPDALEALLRWLLAFAVGLEYRDGAEAYNAAGPPMDAGGTDDAAAPSTSGAGAHEFNDWGRPEVADAVARLARMAHADSTEGLLAKQLQVVTRVTGEAVLPAAAMGPRAAAPLEAVQQLPLGFTTGDARVDAAGTLLRLRFINELRALQSQIDGAVVGVQELTANPRIEAALGRVGR